MTIFREFLGQRIEIELTDEELLDAYMAKQHEYDKETIGDYLDAEGYDIEKTPEGFIGYLAREYRREKDEAAWNDQADLGILDEVLEKHSKVMAEYKEG